MKQSSIILLLLVTTCCIKIFGQTDSTENSIDKQLSQCLDSSQNYTTSGMIACTVKARDAWDKELNKYYNLLMQTLSKDEKAKLITAQKNWLKFRDCENTFVSTMYKNMQGTMWNITKIQADLSIIKQRALQLQSYYGDKTQK